MAHLYKFRQGWQSENLARFLLSEISFIAQPSTVADDVGSDFYCTLFEKEKAGSNLHLLPRNSFVIQIKSSDADVDLSDKVAFLKPMELPFFIGQVDRQKLSIRIYSGRGLHLLFSMKGLPNKLIAQLVPAISDRTYYENVDKSSKHYNIKFPLIAEFNAQDVYAVADKIGQVMAEECGLIHQNISSRRMGEYVLQFGADDVRIFAGSGSVNRFRQNFCLRLAEVFYNLEWIFRNFPQKFSKDEFLKYSKFWTSIRPEHTDPHRAFVDEIHERLAKEIN